MRTPPAPPTGRLALGVAVCATWLAPEAARAEEAVPPPAAALVIPVVNPDEIPTVAPVAPRARRSKGVAEPKRRAPRAVLVAYRMRRV